MRYLSIFLVLVAFACGTDDGFREQRSDTLHGSWLFFERGYSPGDRYIVEDVPVVPQQLIRFNEDSSFESNIDGYKTFKRFDVHQDTEGDVLTLYTADGTGEGDSLAFDMILSEDRLELRTRWCVEGCHEAFRRTEK